MTSIDATNGNVSLTNYVSYEDSQTGRNRVGHYDFDRKTIQPLAFVSGTYLDNLYQVIEAGEANIISSGRPFPASSAKILPPFPDRDVLCVGKNYAEHAKEFNSSGFDSSDNVDTPSHPVIFTKRFTSIIADGEDIFPHPEFTETMDYEGEIGVIIGKTGFRISETDAMDHVWGYTIVNDITARERQRNHKQFYIGKSADTFCPMGPIAVPASRLDKVLGIQTYVNGELRQSATTNDLIFSIPFLIKVMSEGQTLMPGDVLATGTPAGVGIGRKPPIYLKSGDTMAVSVTGLGTLTNSLGELGRSNPTVTRLTNISHIRQNNTSNGNSKFLRQVNDKPLFYDRLNYLSGPQVVFVHGLGGSAVCWSPIIEFLSDSIGNSHSPHILDLEGHGLSPTSPLNKLSIESFAADLNGIFENENITSNATIVAQDMGCLVAVHFALAHSDKVSGLILISPPPSPLLEADSIAMHARADAVRTGGIAAYEDATIEASNRKESEDFDPLVIAMERMSVLAQDPEGYAKACTALAEAPALDFSAIQARTLLVVGSEDQGSTPQLCDNYVKAMNGKATMQILEGLGRWLVFDDPERVASIILEHL